MTGGRPRSGEAERSRERTRPRLGADATPISVHRSAAAAIVGNHVAPRVGAQVMSRRAVLAALGATAVTAVAAGCSDGPAGEEERRVARRETGGGDGGPELRYGQAGLQVGKLSRPDAAAGGAFLPVVVLVHGGFWRPGFDRSLMDPLAESVVAEGWAAWNLDYRPTGGGGGWPTTFTDVAAGIDHLTRVADDEGLDLARVAVVGHSAGGTLALWSAARAGSPEGAPGAGPQVRPTAVVSLAGVADLAVGSRERLGQGAVDDLMGGSATEDGEAYGLASPIERLPLDVAQLLVHGEDDPLVPVAQSRRYADRAREAGDEVRADLLAGVDHFDVIDPRSDAWTGALRWLGDQLT